MQTYRFEPDVFYDVTALRSARRLGLMLEFDAVVVFSPGGVRPVDPQRIFPRADRLSDDLDAVGLGRSRPLFRRPGLEVPRQMTSAEIGAAVSNGSANSHRIRVCIFEIWCFIKMKWETAGGSS